MYGCIFAFTKSIETDFCIVYKPNLKQKSDADIIRDAQLEAMGLRAEDHEHRRNYDKPQVATDEIVSLQWSPYCKWMVVDTSFHTSGYGKVQEEDEKIVAQQRIALVVLASFESRLYYSLLRHFDQNRRSSLKIIARWAPSTLQSWASRGQSLINWTTLSN